MDAHVLHELLPSESLNQPVSLGEEIQIIGDLVSLLGILWTLNELNKTFCLCLAMGVGTECDVCRRAHYLTSLSYNFTVPLGLNTRHAA